MAFIAQETVDCDVLIAGGGPAGAAAAYYLAQAGYRVTIVDFQQFPRDKVCGDFVGPVAIEELSRMGLAEDARFTDTHIITKAAVFLDGKTLLEKAIPAVSGLPDYGRVIPRELLDDWILKKAEQQGVRVLTPYRFKDFQVFENLVLSTCTYKGKDIQISARVLVGADGSSSTVARILHGKKPDPEDRILAVRAYFDNIGCVPHQAELYFSRNSFPGYYWFFPTSPTSANIGVGMVLENFPKEETNLKELLTDLIESDPILSSKVGNGAIRGKIVGWPLSTYKHNQPLVAHRVLLTGDAAGLINSLNGEGIQYALQSGRWAAESLIACLKQNDLSAHALTIYEQKLKGEIALDMSISNLVIQFIRNRNLTDFWLQMLSVMTRCAAKDDAYATTAGGILAGLVPAKDAVSVSFVGKTLMGGALQFSEYAGGIVKKGLPGIVEAGMDGASTALAYAAEAFKQRGEYWEWGKGISAHTLKVAGLFYEDILKSRQK